MTSVPGIVARSIGGFRVLDTDAVSLIRLLNRRMSEGKPTELYFANANFVVRSYSFAEALTAPEALIVNDGIGIDLASWIIHGRFFRENLNGTDFTPKLLACFEGMRRVFLLGGRPDAVNAAAAQWSQVPHIDVVGAIDGFSGMTDDETVCARIRQAAPDILLVALGDPLQGRWMVSHRGRHGVPLVIGVGALFDFTAGQVARAPSWLRRMRLEWAFRLALEPRRLMRRYSIDLLTFFLHCARVRRAETRARFGEASHR